MGMMKLCNARRVEIDVPSGQSWGPVDSIRGPSREAKRFVQRGSDLTDLTDLAHDDCSQIGDLI